MTLLRVAALKRHLEDREVPVGEQGLRTFHAPSDDELMWRHPDAALEHAREVKGARSRLASQRVQGDVLLEVGIDVLQHPPQLP